MVNFSRKIYFRITSLRFDLFVQYNYLYFCASDCRRACLHLIINMFSQHINGNLMSIWL